MDPVAWTIFLAVAGLLLIGAEMLLPAHGLIGILGLASLCGAIGCGFWVNQYVGLASLIGVVLFTPLAWGLWVKIWPRTPLGKRMVLQTIAGDVAPQAGVAIGQTGLAVSELRPFGVCEFDGARLEAFSEHGIIAAGKKVVAVSMNQGRVMVRPV